MELDIPTNTSYSLPISVKKSSSKSWIYQQILCILYRKALTLTSVAVGYTKNTLYSLSGLLYATAGSTLDIPTNTLYSLPLETSGNI